MLSSRIPSLSSLWQTRLDRVSQILIKIYTLRVLCQKFLDPCELAITQAEIRCRGQFFNLAGAARTNNGSRDGWIKQCPGNSDDARRDVVLLTNVCEQLCQLRLRDRRGS